MDVVLYYENVNRELDIALLIKNELKRRDINVKLRNINTDMYKSIVFDKAKLILIPWCYDNKNFHYFMRFNSIKKNVPIIFNLHYEQVLNRATYDFILPKENALKMYHLSWGEGFTEELIKRGVDEKLILESNNPRMDFYKSKYKSLNKTKDELADEFKLDKNKKWILFAENFNTKDREDSRIEDLSKRGRKGLIALKKEAQIVYEMTNVWLENFLQQTNSEVIYRLHPSSNINNYKEVLELAEKYENFKIISKYDLKDWIVNVDIINVWRSTTACEAVYSNKKVNIIKRKNEVLDGNNIEVLEGNKYIDSEEKFILENNSFEVGEVNKVIRRNMARYYKEDQSTTIDNICRKVCEILDNESDPVKEMYLSMNFNTNKLERTKLYFLERIILFLYKYKIVTKRKYFKKNIQMYNLASFYDVPQNVLMKKDVKKREKEILERL